MWDIARGILIDPTTYAPAIVSYKSQMVDWKTSQVLFEHGWLEQNPRFTLSRFSNDIPVSYVVGKRLIRRDALAMLQWSVTNNLAVGIGERLLAARYPQRRKLIRIAGWIERISFATYVTYTASAEHLRQASRNRKLALTRGY